MNRDWASLVLRIGLAFAFLYPPFNALSNPDSWIGYFPAFMQGIVPDGLLLHGFGVVEVIIALWLLSGWKIFWPSSVAAIMLLAIVFFNLSNFEVIFRDISIAAMAITLAIQSFRQTFKKREVYEHAVS
ncbi:hypothetical protein C4568_02955 [Candidatus Parcubacteria bacterium]|nr:MAG: hypothetical protein C4568_02955 [Candidatus Parcubacteria bacterium]